MIQVDEKQLLEDLVAKGPEFGLSEAESRQFAKWFYPEIKIISQTQDELHLAITPTKESTLAALFMGADTNYKLHCGKRGITQSSVLISVCCVAVCRFAGGVLKGIAPDVTFENPLLLGNTAYIQASRELSNNQEYRTTATRLLGKNWAGQPLFDERIITTRTPRRPPNLST